MILTPQIGFPTRTRIAIPCLLLLFRRYFWATGIHRSKMDPLKQQLAIHNINYNPYIILFARSYALFITSSICSKTFNLFQQALGPPNHQGDPSQSNAVFPSRCHRSPRKAGPTNVVSKAPHVELSHLDFGFEMKMMKTSSNHRHLTHEYEKRPSILGY